MNEWLNLKLLTFCAVCFMHTHVVYVSERVGGLKKKSQSNDFPLHKPQVCSLIMLCVYVCVHTICVQSGCGHLMHDEHVSVCCCLPS